MFTKYALAPKLIKVTHMTYLCSFSHLLGIHQGNDTRRILQCYYMKLWGRTGLFRDLHIHWYLQWSQDKRRNSSNYGIMAGDKALEDGLPAIN